MKNCFFFLVTACLACAGCFDNWSRPADVLTITSFEELANIPTNSAKRAEIVRLFLRGARDPVTDDDLEGLSATKLQQLDLSEIDRMEKVPQKVWSFKGLTSLWLAYNGFKEIPDGVTNLTALTYLNLDGNSITNVPEDSLKGVTKLRWLRLNGNQISELPDSLSALKDMRRLYMRQNRLTAVPEVVKKWPELEDLVLDDNQGITSVPDWVGTDLPKLKSLSLKGCPIEKLPADLSGLRGLSTLNVADCKFSSEEVERVRKALGDKVVILF